MDHHPKSRRLFVLRLIVGLTLLGCPWVDAAQETWSVIASNGTGLGQVNEPMALAVDATSNLYIADDDPATGNGRIHKRDAQGKWSVIAIRAGSSALAVDAAGNLYVVGGPDSTGAIQPRDAQGNWSVIATEGAALGQVSDPSGLGVDGAGNLYVADTGNGRVLKYTPQP